MKLNIFHAALCRSPFAALPGERLSVQYVPHPQDIRPGRLERQIIRAVNWMLAATPALIHRFLAQTARPAPTKREVRQALTSLTRSGCLTRLVFLSSHGEKTQSVYMLGERGTALIRADGSTPNQPDYAAGLDAIGVKRTLSTLRFLLAGQHTAAARSVELSPVIAETGRAGSILRGHLFRPNAIVDFTDKTMLVESVRRYGPCEEPLLPKLKRIDATLRDSKYLNVPLHRQTELVLICEDFAHMCAAAEAVRTARLHLCCRLVFTNDNDIARSPDNCLYPFSTPRRWERLRKSPQSAGKIY